MRPLPGQSFDNLLNEFNIQSVEKISKFTKGFLAPALPTGEIKDLESLVVELGLEPSPPVNFWTEASLFNEAGYKAIVYGPGNIADAHQPNESVAIDELEKALTDFKKIVQ
jgi:acetylornithine deacetylase